MDILMGLYQSPVADIQIKKVILEVCNCFCIILIYIKTLVRASKLPNTSLNLIHKSGLGTFLHACTISCTNYTDVIWISFPTIIKSFAEFSRDLESSTSAFVGMVNNLSVYLKGLAGWIIKESELDNPLLTASLLSHTLHTLTDFLTDPRVKTTPFSNADLLKLIFCAEILARYKFGKTSSSQKCAPSDMFFASLGPPMFAGTTQDLERLVMLFIVSVKDLDFSDPLFGQVLEWVSNRIAIDDTCGKVYAKWLISCRLSSRTDVSFSNIQASPMWNKFMTRFHRISRASVGKGRGTHNLYNTLFMLILRDISAHQQEAEDLWQELSAYVSLVPSPRSIVEQTWFTDDVDARYPKGEQVFAHLCSKLWGV